MKTIIKLFCILSLVFTMVNNKVNAQETIDESTLINTQANKNQVSVIDFTSECNKDMEGSGLGTAAATLDYNNNTYWHSEWGEDANRILPQHISYDLGQNYYVNAITFLPKQSGEYINGDIFELKIYVSEDSKFDQSELKGTFSYDDHNETNLTSRDFHQAILNTTAYGRYVKVEVTLSGSHEGANLYASMAEIRFYGTTSIPISKDALNEKIEEAKALDMTNKIEESKQALEDAITKAEEVSAKENATQEEVDEALNSLQQAIDALKDKDVVVVDKEALQAAIDEANTINTDKITEESATNLKEALDQANTINNKVDATQEEVDEAAEALKEAIKKIVIALPFVDVKENDWFYQVVADANYEGLMGATGKGSEYFEPDTNISRAMVATVLYRMAGLPKTTYVAKFPDVNDPSMWYATAITWASSEEVKVVSGYGNGLFGCDDNITRQDLAIMLRNYATFVGLDTKATADLRSFLDNEQVDGYAKSAVEWCVANKIMTGSNKADGTYLQPRNNATRAECAKMFTLLNQLTK